VLATSPASAEEPGGSSRGVDAAATNEQQARAQFQLGLKHFNVHHYEAAITAFEAGYDLKPLPLFLFNIAQSAREAGKTRMAIDYFQRYIGAETVNDAPELAAAARWLNQLRRQAASLQGPEETSGAPARLPAIAQSTPHTIAIATAPPPQRPTWKRGWFWGTLAGVVVVVGATATAVALTVPRAPPSTDYGPIRPLGP
jgi:hypothetical protein